eukprot:SAG11_NODE_21688_length_420_cov_1.028037_1_plen_92_part_00
MSALGPAGVACVNDFVKAVSGVPHYPVDHVTLELRIPPLVVQVHASSRSFHLTGHKVLKHLLAQLLAGHYLLRSRARDCHHGASRSRPCHG